MPDPATFLPFSSGAVELASRLDVGSATLHPTARRSGTLFGPRAGNARRWAMIRAGETLPPIVINELAERLDGLHRRHAANVARAELIAGFRLIRHAH